MSTGTVGATRNRTDLFLKYRSQARGTSRLMRPGGSPSIPADRCSTIVKTACVVCASLMTKATGVKNRTTLCMLIASITSSHRLDDLDVV